MAIPPVNVMCSQRLNEIVNPQLETLSKQALGKLYNYRDCCPDTELMYKSVILKYIIARFNFNPGQFPNVPVTMSKYQATCFCEWVTRRLPSESPAQLRP